MAVTPDPIPHVARTDQDTFGHVFRRNMPFGAVTRHGTMFVEFCSEQRPLSAMLEARRSDQLLA
jgi:porphyrinogen peroxidase